MDTSKLCEPPQIWGVVFWYALKGLGYALKGLGYALKGIGYALKGLTRPKIYIFLFW